MNSLNTLQHQNTLLHALLDISRYLATADNLDHTLQMIIEKASYLMNTERATVFLYDENTRELYIRAALEQLQVRFSIDVGIAGSSGRNHETILIRDAYADARFNKAVDIETGFRTRNLIATPLLNYNGDLVGVLEVINKRDSDFFESDMAILEILAAQAGVAIQKSRLIENQLDRARLQKEIRIAADIQQQCLPTGPIGIPNYDVHAFFQPAEHVGGDCYDFFALDGGEWLVVLGDATGHGIGSALISAETRALARGVSSGVHHLVKAVNQINELLVIDLPADKFITAVIGFLDPLHHRLTFISAGQEPILFYSAESRTIAPLRSTGPPLGILPGLDYSETRVIDFQVGDTIWILTDGFPEYQNRAGEFFEVERITECLLRHADTSLEKTSKALMDAVHLFASAASQQDDLTMVMIRRVA